MEGLNNNHEPHDSGNVQETGDAIKGAADRVHAVRKAAKKKAVKKANAKIYEKSRELPKTTRLKFTDAERKDDKLVRHISKSDKAAYRYEKARAKLDGEKLPSAGRVSDKTSGGAAAKTGNSRSGDVRLAGQHRSDGAAKTRAGPAKGKSGAAAQSRLIHRDRNRPLNGKLMHSIKKPGKEAAALVHREAAVFVLREVRQSNNSGLSAADSAARAAGGAARKTAQGYRSIKLRPHRAALKAEQKAVKANANALYKRSLRMNPELSSANPLKKMQQKRSIKREYAKAFRKDKADVAKKAAQTAKNAAAGAKAGAQRSLKSIASRKRGFLMLGGALLAILLLMSGFTSCLSIFGGGFNSVITTSYTADDADIAGADSDYALLESLLAAQIGNTEIDHPGFDEYRYFLDEIGHDPFTLASYLTARFDDYTQAEVQAELALLFAQQYELTLTTVVETRYRIEDVPDGEGGFKPEPVPYDYHILNVTLKNKSLGNVALANMSPDETDMYLVYMETQGNRPELFEGNPYAGRGDYLSYDVPPDALSDATFAAMLAEAEKHLGLPYVWGGYDPSSGFDCSGFVSWVVNHSGWNLGRLGAKGLFGVCAPVSPADAKPGDLIFFWKTYDAPDPNAPTHVGIYVGNGMMIHTGNPTSYASVTTQYWVDHFYSYGRLN